jgi:hypothetical protein
MGFINYRLNLGLEFITQISKLNLNVIFLIPVRTDVAGYAYNILYYCQFRTFLSRFSAQAEKPLAWVSWNFSSNLRMR